MNLDLDVSNTAALPSHLIDDTAMNLINIIEFS